MNVDYLAQERQWLRLLVAAAIIAVVAAAAGHGLLAYTAKRQAVLLPPAEPQVLGQTLNEQTCASTQCHPVLEEAPITSRHASIACVTCHEQRRSHNEQCIECHDRIRHHSPDAEPLEVALEQMAFVRAELERKHELAEQMADPEARAAFPEALTCVTCHLKMNSRPLTFPQIALAEHLTEDKTADDCADCHRPHDPKPLLGHPIPSADCRRGRDCCLGCHVGPEEGTAPDAHIVDLDWASDEFRAWADLEFGDRLLTPPLVEFDHGHGTVECIACHGVPPSFHTLASRVHDFEHEAVRCGKCHAGATIIDQQVLMQAGEAAVGGAPPHGEH